MKKRETRQETQEKIDREMNKSLNQNNLIDLVHFLKLKEIYRVFHLSRYWHQTLSRSNETWKIIYLSLLHENYLTLFQEGNHSPWIDKYLSNNFSTKIIRELIFQDFQLHLSSFHWKDFHQRVQQLPLILSQCVDSSNQSAKLENHERANHFLHFKEISLKNAHAVPKRAGHSMHLFRDIQGHEFLMQLNGFTTDYHPINYGTTINLHEGTAQYGNLFSEALPFGWYHCSFKVQHCLYYFGGYYQDAIMESEIPTKTVIMIDLNPESMSFLGHFDVECVGDIDEILRFLRGSMAGTVAVDPLPSSPTGVHRCFYFGGKNDFTRQYQNDVYMMSVDVSQPLKMRWEKIAVTGEIPCARNFHSMQLIGRNMFVFGGWTDESFCPHPSHLTLHARHDYFFNDLYSFHIDSFHWTKVTTYGIPPSPRSQANLFTIPNPFRNKQLLETVQNNNINDEQEEGNIPIAELDTFSPSTGFQGSNYLVVYGGASLDPEVRI
jgi:hypothetical protein